MLALFGVLQTEEVRTFWTANFWRVESARQESFLAINVINLIKNYLIGWQLINGMKEKLSIDVDDDDETVRFWWIL